MHTESYVYHENNTVLHAYVAYPKQVLEKNPAVLVAHDWSGRNQFACNKAHELAELGYIGFALDMFGEAKVGLNVEEKQALIAPFVQDRRRLISRVMAAFEALTAMPSVDKQRIAAIGYCFGGMCVLDLARSGCSLSGVVSFHGLLHRSEAIPIHPITASVLALHGYDDPMVSPQQVNEFCLEMTQAKADWQVHMYGHTRHAFTNPEAHDLNMGTVYDKKSDYRSWQTTVQFIDDCFQAGIHA